MVGVAPGDEIAVGRCTINRLCGGWRHTAALFADWLWGGMLPAWLAFVSVADDHDCPKHIADVSEYAAPSVSFMMERLGAAYSEPVVLGLGPPHLRRSSLPSTALKSASLFPEFPS